MSDQSRRQRAENLAKETIIPYIRSVAKERGFMIDEPHYEHAEFLITETLLRKGTISLGYCIILCGGFPFPWQHDYELGWQLVLCEDGLIGL